MNELTSHPFRFTGNSKDYFFICLRTTLLAIITLGIYDAWGTVERRRYLLGHTNVVDHGFDYHAKPTTILFGRLIAIAVLMGWQGLILIVPQLAGYGATILIILMPWLIVKALRFRTRNTSYRSIKMNFTGGLIGAYWAYLFYPALISLGIGIFFFIITRFVPINDLFKNNYFIIEKQFFIIGAIINVLVITITYGILLFTASKRINFMFNHLWFGVSRFSINFPAKKLIRYFAPRFGIIILIYILIMAIAQYNAGDFIQLIPEFKGRVPHNIIATFFITVFFTFLLFGLTSLMFSVSLFNLSLSGLTLSGGHKLNAEMKLGRSFYLLSTNIIAVILSLGLLYPWAVIRFRRYQLSVSTLYLNGDLDHVVAHQQQAGGATAAELGAMEGLSDGVGDGIFG